MGAGPCVLFVCVGNSCRSQMAEGFFNHAARARGLAWRAQSAGTRPAGAVHPAAVAAMAERGIDLSGHAPKGVAPEGLLHFEWVITMGCADRDVCPAGGWRAGRHEDWGIPDPVDQPLAVYRRVRDQIAERVSDLLARLDA